MRHVQLDGSGKIISAFEAPQPDALDADGNVIAKGVPTVPMEETDPRYIAYLNTPPDPRLVLDAAEQAAVKADAQVLSFLNMTPAQLDTWVDNNIGAAGLTLAQVKANSSIAFKVLGRIALAAGRGRILR